MANELKIRIVGDSSGLKGAVDESEGVLKGFGTKIGALSVAAGNLLSSGIQTGVGAAVGFIGDSIGAASDLSETMSKVGVLFGDASGDVERFAFTAAKSLGQSKQQALDGAATFATFGKGAGLAGKDLSKFSTDFVGLASDMASFNNTSPEQAIEAIGAALRGEAEPIRSYGVLLDDATLRQKALELGLISTTKEALTPQQKVLAAQKAIYEQTTAAQGDFARTSDGLANKQRILSARFADMKTNIGEKLLPIALKLATFFSDKLFPVLQTLGYGVSAVVSAFMNMDRTSDGFVGKMELVGIALREVWNWFVRLRDTFQSGGWTAAAEMIWAKITEVFSALVGWLQSTALPAIGAALAAIGRAFGAWVQETAVPYLQENLPIWLAALGDWITGTALPWLGGAMLELAKLMGGWIADAAGYLAENLPGWLATFADWYTGTALPWLLEKVSEFAHTLADWVGDAAGYLAQRLPEWIRAFTSWAVSEAIPTAVVKMAEFQTAMIGWIGGAVADLAQNLPRWIGQFSLWIVTDALPAAVGFGVDFVGAIGDAFRGSLNFMADIASGIVEGLIDGLWSLSGRLASEVSAFVESNIPGPVRSLLRIGSPSKLFYGFGQNVAEGLAGGIDAGARMVTSAANGLASAAAVTAGGQFNLTAAASGGGTAGGGFAPMDRPIVVQIDGRNVATTMLPHLNAYEKARR